MNLFNRAVLIVLLIVLLATTLLSLLVPQTLLDIVRSSVDQIETTIPFYNIFSGLYWAYVGAGLGIILLCVLLLWLELRRPGNKSVQVLGTDALRTEVGVQSITQRLQTDLQKVADVNRVKPKVVSRGKKVDVTLDVQVHPAIDVPSKTEEITLVVREVVEQRMGVKLGKVRVNMQFGPEGPRVVPEPEPLPSYEPDLPLFPAVEPEPELPEVILPDVEVLETEPEMGLPPFDSYPESELAEMVEDEILEGDVIDESITDEVVEDI